jgi:hypothetical protein
VVPGSWRSRWSSGRWRQVVPSLRCSGGARQMEICQLLVICRWRGDPVYQPRRDPFNNMFSVDKDGSSTNIGLLGAVAFRGTPLWPAGAPAGAPPTGQ